MEKINVAELLRNCPKGMELDCTMFEGVFLERVDKNVEYPIAIRVGKTDVKHLTKEGCWNKYSNAKCVIFPKGKTTWEGFVPPCKFKAGDVLYADCADKESDGDVYKYIFILKEIDSLNNYFSYCHLSINGFFPSSQYLFDKYTPRLSTEEEKEKLFDAIKANGYKWNAETKTLEKLIEPKFKVGDKIIPKGSRNRRKVINAILDNGYNLFGGGKVLFIDQDNWELIPDKFDITTLVPFESKVLVRDYDTQIWIPSFWGKYLKDGSNCSYITTNGCYKYCIPYEGNEHLLGTADDCDDYFKTWE